MDASHTKSKHYCVCAELRCCIRKVQTEASSRTTYMISCLCQFHKECSTCICLAPWVCHSFREIPCATCDACDVQVECQVTFRKRNDATLTSYGMLIAEDDEVRSGIYYNGQCHLLEACMIHIRVRAGIVLL